MSVRWPIWKPHIQTFWASRFCGPWLDRSFPDRPIRNSLRRYVGLLPHVGSQKVSCFCLLDLSAAFNTIDHDMLIPVSHPGLVSIALLSAGSSHISLLPCQMWNRPVLLVHILLRCPPRLCPWSSTLRHVHHPSQYPHFLLFPKPSPLYADDTELFLSFLPTHLDSSIDHLHDALDGISSSMTANLLTLNSSKTAHWSHSWRRQGGPGGQAPQWPGKKKN